MRNALPLACSFLAVTLCFTSTSLAVQKPGGKDSDDTAPSGKSDTKESNKKKSSADPELVAFQKQLDEMTLPKLKELHAAEFNAWTRWRQKNGLSSGCELSRNFATTPERESELVARCQAWRQKIELVDRTIKASAKDTTDRQAFEQQLDSMPIAKLRELYGSETQAYGRWREQNHMDSGCRLNSRFAASKEKEAGLVAKCQEWDRKIKTIKAALGRREPATKGKDG